jgi:hypothetical protein
MDENQLYRDVLDQLEVTDEAHARDQIRIVRAVLLAHDRELSRELARVRLFRDSPLAY